MRQRIELKNVTHLCIPLAFADVFTCVANGKTYGILDGLVD